MGIKNLFEGPLHFEFYLGTLFLSEVFEHYLNFRQLRVINRELKIAKDPDRKPDVGNNKDSSYVKTQEDVNVYLMSADYHKTVDYARDKLLFQIVSSLIQTKLSLLLLFTLFGPKLWHFAGSLLKTPSETYQSLIFCGIKLLLDTAVEVPFGFYSDFVVEEKHGFNKKTVGLFFKDLCISVSLQLVIGAPVLSIVIFLVNWGGELFYLYVFGFIVVFYFFMLVIYPEVIAPLFNKYEPLEAGELKDGIEDLARRFKFPLREIKQMDGSKRSSHSNMYFYGLWRFKKIVVYDTLLKQPTSQIMAITMHELGHWMCNHTVKLTCFNLSQVFALFYLFKWIKDDAAMYESFGYGGVNAFVIGMTLFGCIYTPVGVLLHILANTLTRRGEYEADQFAVKHGHGQELARALVQIHHNNKSMIHHDSFYSWFHFTHPVLFERLYAIYKGIEDTKAE